MATSWAYFDTSALVKRYVREVGSPRARALLRKFTFLSSAVTPVEVIFALSRRRAAGNLLDKDFDVIVSQMRRDRAHWELVEVSPLVLARAEELIPDTGVRTLDAIHLASAGVFQDASGIRVPFVTADMRQREAAKKLDLNLVWVK